MKNLAAVLAANPGLSAGQVPPAPMPAAAIIPMVRAQQPGGELLGYLQSTDIEYFEQLYRVLPPTGMFSASPNKPVTFTMGAFHVPKSQVLVILDYSFNIYRFSGAAAGDFVPVENNRLSTQVMWDIKVNERRQGQNLRYQIIPQPATQSQQTFAPNNPLAPPQQWQFDQVRAVQLQGPGGPALSGMPQRHHRSGQVRVSNQYVAKSGDTFNVTCSIINQIPIPIGFFEANVMGVLLSQNVYDAYQAANAPTGSPQVAIMVPQK